VSTTEPHVVMDSYRARLTEAVSHIDTRAVEALVHELLAVRKAGAKVLLAGNGGSAATVNHVALDWMLGTGIDNPPLRVISLAESVSSITASGNDKGFETIFSRQLERLVQTKDLLVVVSASGNSPNLIAAVQAAKVLGIRSVSITGFDGGKLCSLVDLSVHIPTAPNDYGVAEDSHLAIGHMVKEALIEMTRHE
jgi:D-sedoheptulose 7-phosphate isomerase